MNHILTNNTWEFGGLLSGAPASMAWDVFGALALLGFLLAWWSYRHTVRPLTGGKRAVLIFLRTVFLGTLLVCLANPVKVARTTLEPAVEKHRLAVVVDRSDSMTTVDNRGRSRLTDALRTWKRIEPGAHEAFAETNYYSLAKDLRPAATLDGALARTSDTGETWLYQNLMQLIAAPPNERPDSIVVLTDGLDTSSERADRLVARALTERVTLYFVAGSNRLQPQPFLRVREMRVPPSVLRNTEFTLDGTLEAFSNEAKTTPYTLWRDNKIIASGNFTLSPGHNVLPWQTKITAGEPGELELILRLGTTTETQPAARTATQVVAHEKIRVLLYEGALDWSFRYIVEALETDPSFELTSLANPKLNVTLAVGSGLTRLPDSADGLKDFDFVILAHLFPAQLTPNQQQTLLQFTRQGGGVLITSLDAGAPRQFAGQPVAELLPVTFSSNASVETASALAERLRNIRQISADGNLGSSGASSLTPFTITPTGLALPIFAQAGAKNNAPLIPRFAEYALASRIKPGTEVLAVHPTDRDPETHQPFILLATQMYGRGRTAILTTDGLWRWKLSEPSDSRVVETFWQQLLLWLGQGRMRGARFVDMPAQVSVGDEVAIKLSGITSATAPKITATGPDGKPVGLTVQPTGDSETPWAGTWTATTAGAWELSTDDQGGTPARSFVFAIEQARGELAQAPPALDKMRSMADATRGALLDEATPSSWQAQEAPPPTVVNEQRTLLWDQWPVLALAFTAFALELCLRRLWKLL